jgi:two-component system, LytTR family, response regulator
MGTSSKTKQLPYGTYKHNTLGFNEIAAFEQAVRLKNIFQNNNQIDQDDQTAEPVSQVCKKSFLVFRYNKYVTVPTDNIAFFYIKFGSSIMSCFNRQEYSINYSLEHIQHIVSELQFYRLNRQILINFNAIKEVEHYFSRKLLVKLIVPVSEKLLVSREKASSFLRWLENR